MDLALFAPPVIFIGISLLLTHFFNDADRHRGICAHLRAKYILSDKGPQSYLDEANTANIDPIKKIDLRVQIIEDYLRFRAIKLHFGIINGIIILGLALVIAILAYTVQYCCHTEYWYVVFPILLLFILCFVLQVTYAEQGITTSRRINELEGKNIVNKGTFEQQCEEIMGDELPDIKNHRFYLFTKKTIWYYSKFGNFWACVTVDAVFLLLIFLPLIVGLLLSPISNLRYSPFQ
jgi:hypothetical protein